MKIVLLGLPEAGKGTWTRSISNRYSIPHISTGDVFRENIPEDTPLGVEAKKHIDKGQLIPDEVTINMVKDRLQQDDCKSDYLLDGFPRIVDQVEAPQEFLSEGNENLDTALLIEVPTEFILRRTTGRRVCPSCGVNYHIKFNPPTITGKCDVRGSDIIQRRDDTEEAVFERLDVHERQTQPLIGFYRERNLLSIVDGIKAINGVFEDICNTLRSVE